MALTQKELDQMICADPDCTSDHSELFIHSKCHPKGATYVGYDKATGQLNIICSVCEEHIVSIAVAADKGSSRQSLN